MVCLEWEEWVGCLEWEECRVLEQELEVLEETHLASWLTTQCLRRSGRE